MYCLRNSRVFNDVSGAASNGTVVRALQNAVGCTTSDRGNICRCRVAVATADGRTRAIDAVPESSANSAVPVQTQKGDC